MPREKPGTRAKPKARAKPKTRVQAKAATRSKARAKPKLTVAVTGPTGDIGKPFLAALERSPQVAHVRGMARRPFDPAEQGLRKTVYMRGDILARDDLDRLVDGADVVVHLAFAIFGSKEETRQVNLEGSRNVFEASAAAGAKRLVYTSSVAAYGFDPGNPQPLTEATAVAGTGGFYYSAQKAELEDTLEQALRGSRTDAYVFRPCIVAGPESLLLIENLPYVKLGRRLPDQFRQILAGIPIARPVLPDPGTPFQLVHADDVARALVAAVAGRGEPGAYNLAAPGELTMGDVADEIGWIPVPVPAALVEALAATLPRVPLAPSIVEWLHALRTPVLMDTARARSKLRWRPMHDARETLAETVAAGRASGLLTA